MKINNQTVLEYCGNQTNGILFKNELETAEKTCNILLGYERDYKLLLAIEGVIEGIQKQVPKKREQKLGMLMKKTNSWNISYNAKLRRTGLEEKIYRTEEHKRNLVKDLYNYLTEKKKKTINITLGTINHIMIDAPFYKLDLLDPIQEAVLSRVINTRDLSYQQFKFVYDQYIKRKNIESLQNQCYKELSEDDEGVVIPLYIKSKYFEKYDDSSIQEILFATLVSYYKDGTLPEIKDIARGLAQKTRQVNEKKELGEGVTIEAVDVEYFFKMMIPIFSSDKKSTDSQVFLNTFMTNLSSYKEFVATIELVKLYYSSIQNHNGDINTFIVSRLNTTDIEDSDGMLSLCEKIDKGELPIQGFQAFIEKNTPN